VGWLIYWLGFRVERDTITAQSFLFTKLPDGFAHHILLKVLFSFYVLLAPVENAA